MGMIFKHQLNGMNTFDLRQGSKVLHVGEQKGILHLWATVDKSAESKPLTFVVLPTGGNAPSDYTHIGSVQMSDGLVWHVFQTKNPAGE